jgi:outer membrane biosynthesis protein TonB
MATTNHTPEAITLAAGLLAQAKGDIAAARRAAGEAHGWLCSIDASYKPEPVAQAADDGKARELQRKLDLTLQAQAETRQEAQAATTRIAELTAQLSAVQFQLKQTLQAQAKPAPQAVTPPPLPVQAPAPAPVPVQPPKPAPAPAPAGDDPFAHLPPNMRAWAAKRASLEID